MATAEAEFKWKKNLACVSCYKILAELHQFDPGLSFDKAATTSVKKLNYWPLSTDTADILQLSAQLLTQAYIPLLAKNYVLKPQNNSRWKDVRRAMQKVLVDKASTLADLARVIDDMILFEDEHE